MWPRRGWTGPAALVWNGPAALVWTGPAALVWTGPAAWLEVVLFVRESTRCFANQQHNL